MTGGFPFLNGATYQCIFYQVFKCLLVGLRQIHKLSFYLLQPR